MAPVLSCWFTSFSSCTFGSCLTSQTSQKPFGTNKARLLPTHRNTILICFCKRTARFPDQVCILKVISFRHEPIGSSLNKIFVETATAFQNHCSFSCRAVHMSMFCYFIPFSTTNLGKTCHITSYTPANITCICKRLCQGTHSCTYLALPSKVAQ